MKVGVPGELTSFWCNLRSLPPSLFPGSATQGGSLLACANGFGIGGLGSSGTGVGRPRFGEAQKDGVPGSVTRG